MSEPQQTHRSRDQSELYERNTLVMLSAPCWIVQGRDHISVFFASIRGLLAVSRLPRQTYVYARRAINRAP